MLTLCHKPIVRFCNNVYRVFIIHSLSVVLQCEKNGLDTFCSGISAGRRYLSINSVKRGIVPDRNVLLKGICWTMPRAPWWVLKFAGEQPNAEVGGEGGTERKYKWIREKIIQRCLSSLPAEKKKTKNRWQVCEVTGKDVAWRNTFFYNSTTTKNKGKLLLLLWGTEREEPGREIIWLAKGKIGTRWGERKRWGFLVTLTVTSLRQWRSLGECRRLHSLPISLSWSQPWGSFVCLFLFFPPFF